MPSQAAFDYLNKTSIESRKTHEQFVKECGEKVVEAAQLISACLKNGGKVLIFGNGGSAADAQHMAAEMVGKMLIDRKPRSAIALTTDSSNLTAVGNDFGYDFVFVKQIHALARKEDVVVAISTSGNSRNVVLAVEEAKILGCKVIGLLGGSGGKLKSMVDIPLTASLGANSCRVQETHIFAIHSMIDLVDRFFHTD